MGFKTIERGDSDGPGWTYRPKFWWMIPGIGLATGSLISVLVAASIEAANGMACQSTRCGGRLPSVLAVLAGVVLVAVCVGLFSGLFIYVRVNHGVLSARRLWWRRVDIDVSRVSNVEPSYYGLTIQTEDGRSIRSTTPQQANVNAWRNKRGISGEVIDRILAARDSARNEGSPLTFE